LPRHSPYQRCAGSGARAGDVPQFAAFDVSIPFGDNYGTGINDDLVAINVEHVELAKEHLLIYHAAGGNTECGFVRLHATGNLAQNEIFAVDPYCVPRIRSTAADEPRRV